MFPSDRWIPLLFQPLLIPPPLISFSFLHLPFHLPQAFFCEGSLGLKCFERVGEDGANERENLREEGGPFRDEGVRESAEEGVYTLVNCFEVFLGTLFGQRRFGGGLDRDGALGEVPNGLLENVVRYETEREGREYTEKNNLSF